MNIPGQNLRLTRTTARANTTLGSSALEKYLDLAAKAEVPDSAGPYVEAVIAECRRAIACCAAADAKLATLEADVEASAAIVAESRHALAAAHAVETGGTLDDAEALRARDATCIAASRNRKLESDHRGLLGSHGAASAAHGEASRLLQKIAEARRVTAALAAAHAGFGCSPVDATGYGEAVTDEIQLGMWALSEPAVLAAVVPVERRDPTTGVIGRTRTADELQALFETRRRSAITTLQKR